jgi:hypothetical protein
VKNKMNQTKIFALTIALAIVAVAAVGAAYAQITNTPNPAPTQTPQQNNNGYWVYVPNNGTYVAPCYPYQAQNPNSPQTSNSYQYGGCGREMCGRLW